MSQKEEMQKADFDMVQKHVDQLGEHFDSIQIFCTRHDQGGAEGTVGVTLGAGNWFARMGQTKDWIKLQDEDTRVRAWGDAPGKEDGGE